MKILRFSFIGTLLFCFSLQSFSQETNNADSTKNTIIIASVLVGGALLLFGGYFLASRVKAKNSATDSLISDMVDIFEAAKDSWHSNQYENALKGFKNFNTLYQINDNRRVKSKLTDYNTIALQAISVIPHQMDTSAYKKAKKIGNISSYKNYLTNYINGAFKKEIKDLLRAKKSQEIKLKLQLLKEEKQLYIKVKNEETLEAYIEYATKFPKGHNIVEVKNKITQIQKEREKQREAQLYQNALSKKTLESYYEYANDFPKGPHIEEINSNIKVLETKLEAELYHKAQFEKTLEAYLNYANYFPNGPHIDEINRKIKVLQDIPSRIKEIIYGICHNEYFISRYQKIIDQENRVGERTGFVDAYKIQKNTRAIIFLEDSNERLKTEYMELTKKHWNSNLCTEEMQKGPQKARYYRRYIAGPRRERQLEPTLPKAAREKLEKERNEED